MRLLFTTRIRSPRGFRCDFPATPLPLSSAAPRAGGAERRTSGRRSPATPWATVSAAPQRPEVRKKSVMPKEPDRTKLPPLHPHTSLDPLPCTVGHRLQHLFKNRREENAVTLDLAYFPTCPLISKQMAKKKKRNREWVGGRGDY